MNRFLVRLAVAALVVWQVEMAVEAGIAASRRPAAVRKVVAPTNKATPAPVCEGPACTVQPQPQYQPSPSRVIIRSR